MPHEKLNQVCYWRFNLKKYNHITFIKNLIDMKQRQWFSNLFYEFEFKNENEIQLNEAS